MARYVRTGPDTFRVEEEDSGWGYTPPKRDEWAETPAPKKPPLPAEWDLSFSSPNEMAKMEAANAGNFDTPARKLLYDTPMRYEPLREGAKYAGRYHPKYADMRAVLPDALDKYVPPPIHSTYGYPGQENVLAHEAAHGWYDEGMSKDTRNEYFLNVREMPGYQDYRQSYGENELREKEAIDFLYGGMFQAMPTEIYAESAMYGGNEIPAEWRDKYYSGLLAPKNAPPPPPFNAGVNLRPPRTYAAPVERTPDMWRMEIADNVGGLDNLRKGWVQPFDSGPRTYAQTDFEGEVKRSQPWRLR